jgi:dTDP-4-amino-4,6-dideoxygalactose transaminase
MKTTILAAQRLRGLRTWPGQELAQDLVPVFEQALRKAAFIGGPMVEAFENEFAPLREVAYCAGVSNGTDALGLP